MDTKRPAQLKDLTQLTEAAYGLPFECGRWLVVSHRESDDNGDAPGGDRSRQLSVRDSSGRRVGRAACADGSGAAEACLRAVLEAMLNPLCGKPRRPLWLAVEPAELTSVPTALYARGVTVADTRGDRTCTCQLEPTSMRACSLCGFRAQLRLFVACPACHCALYCSEDCLVADRQHGDPGAHTEASCDRMREFMLCNDALRRFPFAFAEAVTRDSFGSADLRNFLSESGLSGAGLWRREEPLCPHCDDTEPYGELADDVDPYVLPPEASALEAGGPDRGPPAGPLACWSEYYAWRGFSLASPIAILLQYALTLYHVIASLLPPIASRAVRDAGDMAVLILGAEKEVDYAVTFAELGWLLPGVRLSLYLVGPQVSRLVSSRVRAFGNVRVTPFCGYLSAFQAAYPEVRANAAVAFNAGVAAYASWRSALELLQAQGVPAFFTEYCLQSADLAKAVVESSGLGTMTAPVLNPFRGPLRKVCEENQLHLYSNAVIFHVEFSPSPGE